MQHIAADPVGFRSFAAEPCDVLEPRKCSSRRPRYPSRLAGQAYPSQLFFRLRQNETYLCEKMLAHFVIRDVSSKLLDSGCSTRKGLLGLLVFFATEVQPSQRPRRRPPSSGRTTCFSPRFACP